MTDTPPPNPWDRRPKESEVAYEAFTLFRDAGPVNRSSSRVVSELAKSRQLISRWRTTWEWNERVRAWDAYQESLRQKEMHAEAIEMGRRQATDARAIQMAMMAPIRELLRRLADPMTAESLQRLSTPDLVGALTVLTARAWPTAANAERLARGAPTPDYGIVDDELPIEPVTILDTEDHLREVYAAMEEAGIRPRALQLPSGDGEDG